jgi:hypothetical protein
MAPQVAETGVGGAGRGAPRRVPYLGRYDAKPTEPTRYVAEREPEPDDAEECSFAPMACMPLGQKYGSPAEAEFVDAMLARGFPAPIRNGWPDFLVFNKAGGAYCVEVKRRSQRVSVAQARCFLALNRLGLNVYIWDPKRPSRLKSWRSDIEERGVAGGLKGKAEAKALGLTVPEEDPLAVFQRRKDWAVRCEANGQKAARLARKAAKAVAAERVQDPGESSGDQAHARAGRDTHAMPGGRQDGIGGLR